MQDEELDDIIREAADKHSPAYNDAAWNRMETLLDKHIPQKKDRKRSIFFVLLFTGLTIGGYFAGSYFFAGKKTASSFVKVKINDSPIASLAEIIVEPKIGKDENAISVAKGRKNELPGIGSKTRADIINVYPSEKEEGNELVSSSELNSFNEKSHTFTTKEGLNPINIFPETKLKTGSQILITEVEDEKKKNDSPVKINDEKTGKAGMKTNQTTLAKNGRKKERNGFAGNFGLTFSAGPGFSFVEMSKPGKLSLTYGAGLQYNFTKRLTVQAGFYVSKKLYSSDSANYNPPGSFWNYYPGMNNIEANCKVYELPLSLLYQFKQNNKHNFYAGAGISSYLMKSEVYDFSYKTAAGQPAYRSYTLINKNKHYFSTLSFAGGYRYQLSKRISFAAEPYVKIPLTGVGFGNVKLKSAGVLFTAIVKPFAKRN